MDYEPLTPNCPLCGSLPVAVIPGLAQGFCPNEDCECFLWDLYVSALHNLENMGRAFEWPPAAGEDQSEPVKSAPQAPRPAAPGAAEGGDDSATTGATTDELSQRGPNADC